MVSVQHTDDGSSPLSTRLALKVWHPNFWTLQTTATADAGLLGHRIYETDGKVCARVTAYADTTEDIDVLVDEIRSSDLTESVYGITEYFNPNISHEGAGNTTKELLVEYQPKNSIHNAFISQGFIPEDSIRVRDGHEYWTVIISSPWQEIQRLLDDIRTETNADITVESMKSAKSEPACQFDRTRLSERQREVLELARSSGYYSWPRKISASELAEGLDVSKTTLLEHLRKAEAKLLDPD